MFFVTITSVLKYTVDILPRKLIDNNPLVVRPQKEIFNDTITTHLNNDNISVFLLNQFYYLSGGVEAISQTESSDVI